MRATTLKLRHKLGIALALTASCAAFGASSASAALFIVNTTDDDVVGLCELDTPCSLREAITAANANGILVEDTIAFSFPGNATISPTNQLPSISGNVNIDAPYSADDARVILSGASQGSGDGLHLLGDDIFLRGLVINGFTNVGVLVNGFDASIENVRVGTNVLGTAAVPNGGHGIAVVAIGPGVGTQNMLELDYSVISGNGGNGVWINPNTHAMRPVSLRTANFIGTNVDGTAFIPNGAAGVSVEAMSGSVTGLSIGTLDDEESGNTIAGNTLDGVRVVDAQPTGTASGVRLFRNSIHSNGSEPGDLGLDLQDDGVTPNDVDDEDAGPNELQNFPVLTAASASPTDVNVQGTLSTDTGAQNYRIEVFASPPASCDPSGNGEGARFVDVENVTTDAAGDATFSFSFSQSIPAGSVITATATSPASSTSEFSACITAATLPGTFTVNATDGGDVDPCDEEHCSFREAVSASNAWPARDTIAFDIPGTATAADPHVITVPTAVEISDPVVISGITEPDYDDTPVVVLNGESDTPRGLILTAGDSRIRGLSLVRFPTTALEVLTGDDNIIDGNYIGVLPDGTRTGGTDEGMLKIGDDESSTLHSAGNDVLRNVISELVRINGSGSRDNVLDGNVIGTNPAGTTALNPGSTAIGVVIAGAPANFIGGEEGNVISGFSQGIGVEITGSSADGNFVAGNRIGTDGTGTASVPNGMGVQIHAGADLNVLDRNVISGNDGEGVVIVDADGNRLESNYIGTNSSGDSLANTSSGIHVGANADFTKLGGPDGEGNVIANNGSSLTGVQLADGFGTSVLGNSIHDNGGLGIDLGADGVTANDGPGDEDNGANGLQNFPVIDEVQPIGGSVQVTGELASESATQYRLEFFASPSCDSSEHGEGMRFVGSESVTTNADGVGIFDTGDTLTESVSPGEWITATATPVDGVFGLTSTSEFSECAQLDPPITEVVVTTAQDQNDTCNEFCSLREAITRANSAPGHQLIRFNIDEGGPQTIVIGPDYFTPPLPAITETATLDATTQPGTAGPGAITLDGSVSEYEGTMIGLTVTAQDVTIRGFAIRGFNGDGIHVMGNGAVIEGNLIGTVISGPVATGNNGDGINLANADGATIGGTTAAARNVVSGNVGHGIYLLDSDGNTLHGNYVGTNADGTAAEPNGVDGVAIEGGSSNVVGGAAPGAGNLLSGNTNQGIALFTGFSSSQIPNANVIRGNLIGTNAAGTSALPNGGTGVLVAGAPGTQVGGAAAGQGNVISGNAGRGVTLTNASEIATTTDAVVAGNKIGTLADGTTLLGNGLAGVYVTGGASDNLIGGTAAGAGNVIADNSNSIGTGVRIESGDANSVLGNSIFGNGGLGIDLGTGGVTANDPGDGDGGANNLQNFPELTSVSIGDGGVDVDGSLVSAGSADYRVEFFLSGACDESGNGEGQTFLGSLTVATTELGNGSFSTSFPAAVVAGDAITATATAADGSTSEFSECAVIEADGEGLLSLTSAETSIPVGAQAFPLGSLPGNQLPAYSGAPGSAPVGSIPVGSIPVGSIPVGSIPVGSIPVSSIGVGALPADVLRNVQLSQLPVDWNIVLAGTDLAAGPRQAQTLADVMANQTARTRFLALPFARTGLAQSLLRGVPLSAYLLGAAPLSAICDDIAAAGGTCPTQGSSILGAAIAGAPVGSIPVGSIPVGSIPASTPVGSIPVGSIPVGSIDLAAARLASVRLVDIPSAQRNAVVNCSLHSCTNQANTLGSARAANAIRPGATLAQLLGTDTDGTLGQIGQPPVAIILNDIILGTLPRSALDWERFPLDGLQIFGGTGRLVHYALELNLPCSDAAGLALDVKLPPGFIVRPGSSTFTYGASIARAGGNPTTNAETGARWTGAAFPAPGPCADVSGEGASQLVKLEFEAYPGFSINTKIATASATFDNGARSAQDTERILVTQNWESNDDPASAPVISTDTLEIFHLSTNRDREVFRLPVPSVRGTRTTVYLSHIAQGADYDLVIGQPNAPPLISAPVGSIPVGSIPIPDEGSSVDNSGRTLPPETLQDIPVGSIPVGSISATRGNATEAATVVSQGEGGFYTIQVSGYNGSRSTEAAVLRVVQTPPPTLPPCPARTFPNSAGPNGALPQTLPPTTKALFLYNRSQLIALYGTTATNNMITALDALIANLGGRQSPIPASKLDVSGSPAVRSAYAAWNASPCSITAANNVTAAINGVVGGYRSSTGGLPNLEYVTLLGSDEALPMARLQDPVTISNELDEASDLAFLTNGGTRANALYAAAALGHFLSDAPYGTFVTTPWLNRQLYLPTVPVSRLVETPLEIQRQLQLFVTAQGVLDPDSALTTAYDFLTDGGNAVKAGLDTKVGTGGTSSGLINDTWDAATLGSVFTPSGGSPADILSVNAHYSHNLLQPAAGRTLFSTANLPPLPTNASVEPAFARRVLFTMGCHAGLNVPNTLMAGNDGRLLDWAQAYAAQRAAVYVANTGFGYGDTVANALSERLMSIFARQIGRNGSIGGDWLRSLHDYYNTMGFYGVYDEKALSEATMYGLPFWRVGSAPVTPPAPDITPGGDGTAATTVTPAAVRTDAGRGSFWSENGNVQHTHYRPIQPIVSLDATVPVGGPTVRGAFITTLSTSEVPNVDPFNALPMIDLAANEPERNFAQTFFPANFLHFTRSRQGGLLRQSVEVVTGQSRPESTGGLVTERLLQSIGLQVGFSSAADSAKPLFREAGGTLANGLLTVFADVVDPTGGVTHVEAFVNDGSSAWRHVILSPNGAGLWVGTLTGVAQEPEIVFQARDAAWNVAFTTNKGFNHRVVPADSTGPEVHIERPLPTHALGEQVRAEFACFDPGGVASCTATVDGNAVGNGDLLPSTLGEHTFVVTGVDLAGNRTVEERTYGVGYGFTGFFSPVLNPPALNRVKAGSTVPVKFSLSGNRGLAIIETGYPRVDRIACGATAVVPASEPATSTKPLFYTSSTGRYQYDWKTKSSWAGSCRRFVLLLKDGTQRHADFRLTADDDDDDDDDD